MGVEAEAQKATWCCDWLPRHEPRHGQAPYAVEKKAHFGKMRERWVGLK